MSIPRGLYLGMVVPALILAVACSSRSPAGGAPEGVSSAAGTAAPLPSAAGTGSPTPAAATAGSASPPVAASAGAGGGRPPQPSAAGAGAGGAAGSSGAAGFGGAAGSSGAAGTAAPDDAGTPGPTAGAQGGPTSGPSGTLPAVMDLQKPGPFKPVRGEGPAGFALFYPMELGKDGVKHPIVSWGPGAAENAGIFSTLLNHLASHGFAVISYDATPQGQELVRAIDWMLAENERAGGMFHQKLDTSKIAAGGHSAGSLATFVIAGDKRLTTTLHISGGTFDPHTDVKNLHTPALMICGEPGGDGLIVGDVANPNCEIDFMNATVPVFYGITKGASHMTPTDIGDTAIRQHQLGAIVGWLRWQLAGDEQAKALFSGMTCTLCKDAAWSSIKQKSLE